MEIVHMMSPPGKPDEALPVTSAHSIIKSWQKNGYAESEKQHKKQLRLDFQRLQSERRTRFAIPLFVKNIIFMLIFQNPEMYSHEIQAEVQRRTGRTYHESTIKRQRDVAGYRRRRMQRPRREPDPVQQSQWKELLLARNVQSRHFIFIDETHRKGTDFYRTYGYFRPGCPAFTPTIGNFSEAFSTLAAMTEGARQ
jgi:hypothetical protein